MKRPDKPPTKISESLHHRLNAYALAASAAGAGALALAQPAEARIVYTKAHHHIPLNTFYGVDVNHDGVTDLAFFEKATSTSGSRYAILFGVPSRGNAIEGSIVRSQFYRAFALKRGASIGPPWLSNPAVGDWMAAADESGKQSGNWVNVKDRYIGLKFVINGAYHYGWVRMRVIVPPQSGSIVATLTGYAFETIPGKSIRAGQTKEADDQVNKNLGPGAFLTNPIAAPQPASQRECQLRLRLRSLSPRPCPLPQEEAQPSRSVEYHLVSILKPRSNWVLVGHPSSDVGAVMSVVRKPARAVFLATQSFEEPAAARAT